MSKFLEAALEYRKQNLSVIPLSPNSKVPPKGFHVVPYRTRLATEEEIRKWWAENPNYNVGIVTGKLSNLFVIDLDKHDPAYSEETVMQYVPDNVVCPVVETPKGGQHLYFSYPDENITIGARFIPGCDYRGEGGYVVAPPSANGNGKSYAWHVKYDISATLEQPPKAAIEKINNIDRDVSRGTCKENVSNNLTGTYEPYNILHAGNRNADIFTISNALAKGGMKINYAKQVIEILAKNANPPYDTNEAILSLNSAYSRKENRERNIQQDIREYILSQMSLGETYISLKDCLQSLHVLTKSEKNAAYVAFNRFCNVEKLIEKHGDKRGEYKIIDNEKDKTRMDLLTEPEVLEVPVKLPLELNDMCVISPGNICVVSGSKSSGKTAMMMNIAWKNQKDYNVVYLNSEMSETEFKKRMKKFAPLSHWKIAGYKCHTNFEDYIESSHKNIYIIDFLEVHENFYEIAKPIRKIHEKLGDSLCFIGIQMKSGASLGRGGDFSAEKARLYLTMDFNQEEKRTKVTIYDAKEPRPPFDNVRGKWRNVKIIDGHRLDPAVEWQW